MIITNLLILTQIKVNHHHQSTNNSDHKSTNNLVSKPLINQPFSIQTNHQQTNQYPNHQPTTSRSKHLPTNQYSNHKSTNQSVYTFQTIIQPKLAMQSMNQRTYQYPKHKSTNQLESKP